MNTILDMFDIAKDSLWLAARRGDVESVESMLQQGHNPNGEGRLNPLCGATHGADLEVMSLLLKYGADVNRPGSYGVPAIHYAVDKDALELLASHGARLTQSNFEPTINKDIVEFVTDIFNPEEDSLWYASRKGDIKSVKTILEQGHNPNGEGRLTPLCGAAYNGHIEVMSTLLEAGAEVNKTGIYGSPAIRYTLNNAAAFSLLLENGADITGLNLDQVSKAINNDVVQLLKGAHSCANLVQPQHIPLQDAINVKWSKKEIQALVQSVISRVLFLGEYEVGKTSLVRKLLNRNSKLTNPDERTVVAELNHLVTDEGKNVISLVDLGGHRSYQSSGHYFHCNAANNIAVTCHDINSDDFYQTFTWVKSVLTRSPKCNIILVLTKSDLIDRTTISDRLDSFLNEMQKLIINEIQSLDISIEMLCERKAKVLKSLDVSIKMSDDSKDKQLYLLREKYQWLANNIQEITIMTSCASNYESSIDLLVSQIIKTSNDPANRVHLPVHYQEFYVALGKLGVRLPESQLQNTSGDQTDEKLNEADMNPDGTEAVGTETTYNSMNQVSQKVNVKNITPLQYVTFQDAIDLYKQILIKHNIIPVNIKKDLSQCLLCLHQHGLLMYFCGDKELKQIIFNDLKSFVEILKCIFHHETMTELNFSDIPVNLRSEIYGNNEQKYRDDVKTFHRQGILSYSLLTVLLTINSCNIDPKVVMQLLVVLEVGFVFTPGEMQIEELFIPYHVNGKEMPEFLQEEPTSIHVCDNDTISVKGYISGNLPDTFWNYVILRLFKHQHSFMQSKYVWKNGFWATFGERNVQVLLTYNGKNQIDFTVKGSITDIKGHNFVWNLIKYIDDECDRLSLHWWPGLVTRKIIICTHCGLMDLENPSEWCLDEILLHAHSSMYMEEETFSCERNPRYNVPIGMIRPLPEEESFAVKVCNATKEYINDNIALWIDIREDLDSVESVFHCIADNLPHKYFTYMGRRLGFPRAYVDDMERRFSNKPRRDLTHALLESYQQKQGQEKFDLSKVADCIRAVGELERLALHVRRAAKKIKENTSESKK